MKMFVKSFIFILILILTLIMNGTFERIIYVISGILLYRIINMSMQNEKKFKDYKKVIGGLIAGYLAGNLILIGNSYEIAYDNPTTYNVDKNKTAVILLFDIDPPKYNYKFSIRNFKESNSLINLYKLPIVLYKDKILSEKSSQNMNIYYSGKIAEDLQKNLGEGYTVYKSYINQSPYLEESIQNSIQEGSTQIIISPISVVENTAIASYGDIIQETRFQIKNIEFRSTNYLWNSDLMVESYVEKINSNIQVDDKSRAGIILVGEMLDQRNKNEIFMKQDVLFREKISSLLKKDRYDNNKIRLSYLNKKLIKEEMERLMEYGVGQIIIVHISNESQKNASLETIHNLQQSLEIPQGIRVTQIYGWASDEYIIRELLKRIELAKYKIN